MNQCEERRTGLGLEVVSGADRKGFGQSLWIWQLRRAVAGLAESGGSSVIAENTLDLGSNMRCI